MPLNPNHPSIRPSIVQSRRPASTSIELFSNNDGF